MSAVVAALVEALGDAVRTDERGREAYGRDWWARSDLTGWLGQDPPLPLAVVMPDTTAALSRAISICRHHGTRIIPRGAGSGVVGGVLADERAVVVATDRLAGVRRYDASDGLVTFGAGTLGSDAEGYLADRDATLGHWPQSIDRSSVGGWVATRASGQYSTAYGNIEDMVVGLEAVLADGTIYHSRETPRAAAGPDLRQLLIGSEGTLGIVTEVTLRVLPKAEQSLRRAYHFETFEAGIAAMRATLVPGWRPAVVRLYDPRESARHFRGSCPSGRCMLIFLHEGPAPRAEVEADAVARLCAAHGGEVGDEAAVDAWFEHRNTVPTWRSLFDQGLIADTIEVATQWSRLPRLYEAVVERVKRESSVIAITAHSSHAYQTGANLYFSFAAAPERSSEMLEVYDRCWSLAMSAVRECGGGIAHHHGIGRVRRDWLATELGPTGVRMLRSVKRALDPDDLLNPGVLIPVG